MNADELRASVEATVVFEFARSGGPGGQNVNKVNSKATARLSIEGLGLAEADLGLLRARLAARLIEGAYLAVSASDTRSQLLNRQLAVERLVALIAAALRREKPRRPTAPTRSSRERRLSSKRRDSQIKKGRNSRFDD
ncbi:MAG TPA: alternative ribosome rescue aminoacyl-tRNA hydrolase ArfB [Rectinemataceae bacterium]|nr:alternative ribosome rescue aminoacyl-tRNA hydrolase ArfB [Rectinemataceae bacterium]